MPINLKQLKTMYYLRITALLSIILFLSCKNEENMIKEIEAPLAKKIEKKLEKHGDERIDNYYWLNDRENPDVIDYLNKENEYLEANMKHTESFQKALFEEMKSRIKEDDASVPYKYNGYWYITRYEKGKDYPIYTRKKESLEAEEELLFDSG